MELPKQSSSVSNSIHKQLLVGCLEISIGQSRFAVPKKPLRRMEPKISEPSSFCAILDLSEHPNALIQSGLHTKRQIRTGKRRLRQDAFWNDAKSRMRSANTMERQTSGFRATQAKNPLHQQLPVPGLLC
jgi:hypothetical protein